MKHKLLKNMGENKMHRIEFDHPIDWHLLKKHKQHGSEELDVSTTDRSKYKTMNIKLQLQLCIWLCDQVLIIWYVKGEYFESNPTFKEGGVCLTYALHSGAQHETWWWCDIILIFYELWYIILMSSATKLYIQTMKWYKKLEQ